MVLILWIVIGAIVGWIGAKIAGRDEGFIASTIIGIVGAFIGSWIGQAFGSGHTSYLSFTWAGFFWSIVGAVVLSVVLNLITRRRSSHV